MSTQPITQQVRWQDLKVNNEIDIILEIAQNQGWEDCKIFGYGDMITKPHESKGWKLIPADLYEYSIPTEGIARLHQIINAGVRIRGVIIADDELNRETPPAPANPIVSLPKIESITIFLGRVMRALLLLTVAGAVLSLLALSLIYLAPILILGFIVTAGASTDYDPKLVILVDDGNGGTVWVSIFTWYE